MLPSSKRYLLEGGFDEQSSGFIMVGCFVGGFLGIQIISRTLHQLMPSHVVDCDHTHEDLISDDHTEPLSRRQSRASRSRHRVSRKRSSIVPGLKITTLVEVNGNGNATESTPLLPAQVEQNGHAHPHKPAARDQSVMSDLVSALTHSHNPTINGRSRASTQTRRPSMLQVQKRVMSFMKDTKSNCDEFGPCYGYSDPCGQECFKHLSSRSSNTRGPTVLRTTTGSLYPRLNAAFDDVAEDGESDVLSSPKSPTHRTSRAQSRDAGHTGPLATSHDHDHDHDDHDHDHDHAHAHTHAHAHAHDDEDDGCCSQMSEDLEAQHHHHVPANAFLSIGLQTVIAIALHKFPEGFITYATNHANPTLGLNIFMALFVHNIAEGFAMALPLYMALGSRLRAMLWSSLLGGLSQPFGAALAALWFRLARRSHLTIDSVAYACLFAATAGIMTSVALQLFVESLSLNHNRNLSIFFAFLGMTLLGLSNSLITK